MSTENWLVVVGDETLEISLDDLRALILEGRINATDRVKRGQLNWIEARYAPGLRAAFADRHAHSTEVPRAQASPDPLLAGNRDSRSAFATYLQSDNFPAIVTSIINARCQNHVDLAPTFICATCRTAYCRDCTKVIGSWAGSICPLCESLCLPYEDVRQRILELADRRSKFGWYDCRLALRYPCHEPLTLSITGVIYGACLVFLPYFAAPGYGYLLAGIGLLPALIANALMFGCMTLVINHIAAGRLKYKHVFDLVSLLAEPQEMFSLCTGIMLITTGPLFLGWHFISNHPLVLALALCWLVWYYPLAVLAAAETQQFTAIINPLTGLNAISRTNGNYWKFFLMYAGLIGLTSGIGWAIVMVMFPHDLLKGLGVIWLPVVNLLIFLPVSIVLGPLIFYTNIVIAFLIGRILFKGADEDIF